MNVNEMMSMIDKKVGNDKDRARQKEIETKNRFDIALAKIKELKPRIDDLIKLANYAKGNGIDFNKRGWGGHEGYDTGMFCTNSWSHLVGFVNRNPIKLLGIDAGGVCGDVCGHNAVLGHDFCHVRAVTGDRAVSDGHGQGSGVFRRCP